MVGMDGSMDKERYVKSTRKGGDVRRKKTRLSGHGVLVAILSRYVTVHVGLYRGCEAFLTSLP